VRGRCGSAAAKLGSCLFGANRKNNAQTDHHAVACTHVQRGLGVFLLRNSISPHRRKLSPKRGGRVRPSPGGGGGARGGSAAPEGGGRPRGRGAGELALLRGWTGENTG